MRVRAGKAFTSDSSRYLNCPSNLIGHDHANKPANGERMIRQNPLLLIARRE
jgi:hypothetical protein